MLPEPGEDEAGGHLVRPDAANLPDRLEAARSHARETVRLIFIKTYSWQEG